MMTELLKEQAANKEFGIYFSDDYCRGYGEGMEAVGRVLDSVIDGRKADAWDQVEAIRKIQLQMDGIMEALNDMEAVLETIEKM